MPGLERVAPESRGNSPTVPLSSSAVRARFRASSSAAVATVAVLILVSCVSTQDRFDAGLRLEAEGRPVEAAHAYIDVLEREPGWPGARERLSGVGARAVSLLLSDARVHVESAEYVPAFEALLRLDELRTAAVGVGVTLAVPDDYGAFHEETRQAAIGSLAVRGDDLTRRGLWAEALNAYERARGYSRVPEQRRELTEAMAGVYLTWAYEALAGEDYGTAIELTDAVVQLVGPGHPLAREALALADEATELATRWVAFFPIAVRNDMAEISARAFAHNLSELLLVEYWANPPLHLEPVDSRALSRELRRRRASGRVLGTHAAASIGQELGADMVVVTELTEYEVEEGEPTEFEHRVRLKIRGEPDRDTVWIEQRLRLRIEATVAYRILEVPTAHRLHFGSADAEVSGTLKRGVFPGDYRNLRLTSWDRRLFDGEAEREAIRSIQDRLAEELADELAERIFRAFAFP